MPKAKAAKGTPRPASGPVTLLVGTRKGVFLMKSDRARRSWTLAGPHFLGNIVNHLVLDPRDGKTLLCAVRAGHLGPTVFRSTDFGRTWKEAERPPAFPKAAPGEKGLAVEHVFWLTPGHSSEPGAWYAGVSPPGLFRSDDGGVTWEGVAGFNANPMRIVWIGGEQEQGPPGGATLHSINVDPRDPRHLYIGISAGGAFESSDRGETWRPLNQGVAADFLPV
ncbi:MAG: exo-alpha-sialidase, partial [Betaproteobacteria bacterium]